MNLSDTLYTALTYILCHPAYTNHTFCHPIYNTYSACQHVVPADRHAYSYITTCIHLIPYIQHSRISSAILHTQITHSATLQIPYIQHSRIHVTYPFCHHTYTTCSALRHQHLDMHTLTSQYESIWYPIYSAHVYPLPPYIHTLDILLPYIYKSRVLPPCIQNSRYMSTRGASRYTSVLWCNNINHTFYHPTYTNHSFCCHPAYPTHSACQHAVPADRHPYSNPAICIHLLPYIQHAQIHSATLEKHLK